MERKTKKLLEDVVYLWLKIRMKKKLNYYDKNILDFLEEYDYITEYKKEWTKRDYEM